MRSQENGVEKQGLVSVLVPISERHDAIDELFWAHRQVFAKMGLAYEFIFVVDGRFPEAEQALEVLQARYPAEVRYTRFGRSYGEARALQTAFSRSSGELILTLSSYFQVEPREIPKLFSALTEEYDMVISNRYPRRDSLLNRMQARLFHAVINRLTGEAFHDISCGTRLLRREVLEHVGLYGDLHRFLPLLAIQKGYRVKEIAMEQACEDCHLRLYVPAVYWQRGLDILTIFFLFKFTQKPLRFFGLLGGSIGLLGAMVTLLTVYQRLFMHMSLAERPLFLIGVLLALIGLQTFFIGLVGEIIIFTHMPAEPAYSVEKLLEGEPEEPVDSLQISAGLLRGESSRLPKGI